MTNDPFLQLLEAAAAASSPSRDDDRFVGIPEARAAGLTDLYRRYVAQPETPFKAGDLVVWKDGMKNRRFPLYGEPVVIVEVLDTPATIADPETYGSPVWNEPLDVRFGTVMPDGEFCIYHLDSRRLRHFVTTPDGSAAN